MIDFSLPPDLVELKARVDRFIREAIVPLERDPRQGPHGPSEDFRRELVALGRAAGLLSPHAPVKWGGLGLDHRAMAVVFEAAGWSPLGPLALNIMAPDEGNTNLLDKIANDEQKERWLRPLVAGEIRTVFSMTEPDDGAGSDPSLMKTTARRHGDEFVISGRKWLITGAPGASINIVMARTLDEDGTDRGATMFLVDMDAPGFRIVRQLETLDNNTPGGHAEVEFDEVRVSSRARPGPGRPWLSQCPGASGPGAPYALHAMARRGAALPRDRGGLRAAAPCVRQAYRRASGRGLPAC